MPGAPWACCCTGGGGPGTGVTVCPSPVTGGTTNFTTGSVSLTWPGTSRYEIVENPTPDGPCWFTCNNGPKQYAGVATMDNGLSSQVGCEIVYWLGLATYDNCDCFGPRVERVAIQPETATASFEIWCQAGTPPGGAGWYVVSILYAVGAPGSGWARNASGSAPTGWTIKMVSYGRCFADPCGSRYLVSGFLVSLVGATEYEWFTDGPEGDCATPVAVAENVGGNVSHWYTRFLAAGDTVGCLPGGTYALAQRSYSTCAPLVFCPWLAATGCCGAPVGVETVTECY